MAFFLIENGNVHAAETKTPCIRSWVFSKTEAFFSEYGYRPHITGVFGHRKRRFSNTLSRVEGFENGDSSYSCGRAKTEVFKCDDVMPRFKARSSAHTIRKRYVWTQIFLNTEENISFVESTRIRVDGQIRYVWTQFLFKYGGKNLRFRKYPATRGRGVRLTYNSPLVYPHSE